MNSEEVKSLAEQIEDELNTLFNSFEEQLRAKISSLTDGITEDGKISYEVYLILYNLSKRLEEDVADEFWHQSLRLEQEKEKQEPKPSSPSGFVDSHFPDDIGRKLYSMPSDYLASIGKHRRVLGISLLEDIISFRRNNEKSKPSD
jgi:hypothetical protein